MKMFYRKAMAMAVMSGLCFFAGGCGDDGGSQASGAGPQSRQPVLRLLKTAEPPGSPGNL